jgi:hypothetical protein
MNGKEKQQHQPTPAETTIPPDRSLASSHPQLKNVTTSSACNPESSPSLPIVEFTVGSNEKDSTSDGKKRARNGAAPATSNSTDLPLALRLQSLDSILDQVSNFTGNDTELEARTADVMKKFAYYIQSLQATSPSSIMAKWLGEGFVAVANNYRENLVRCQKGESLVPLHIGNSRVQTGNVEARRAGGGGGAASPQGLPSANGNGQNASIYAPAAAAPTFAQKVQNGIAPGQTRLQIKPAKLSGLVNVRTGNPAAPKSKVEGERGNHLLLRMDKKQEDGFAYHFVRSLNDMLERKCKESDEPTLRIASAKTIGTGVSIQPVAGQSNKDFFKFKDAILAHTEAKEMEIDVAYPKDKIEDVLMVVGSQSYTTSFYAEEIYNSLGVKPAMVKWLKPEQFVQNAMRGTSRIRATGEDVDMEADDEESASQRPHTIKGTLLVCWKSERPQVKGSFALANQAGYRLKPFRYSPKGDVEQCSKCASFLHSEEKCTAEKERCFICSSTDHKAENHKCMEGCKEGEECYHLPKCINCEGAHQANDPACPARPRGNRVAEARVIPVKKRLNDIKIRERRERKRLIEIRFNEKETRDHERAQTQAQAQAPSSQPQAQAPLTRASHREQQAAQSSEGEVSNIVGSNNQ